MALNDSPLSLFHPLVAQWFRDRLGAPTDAQAKSWPVIAQGGHALVTAPTGSGKTMTAFLWALNQLITGVWPTGQISVLYVSPLKALNNDIQRNLLTPLRELKSMFTARDVPFPAIRVLTRSGDTPQADRRLMLRHPPEILITTPESLHLLLSSVSGRSMLYGLNTVILDEIHAVLGTKRGTLLITSVDRLVNLAGDFQRVALSATVKPLETVAEFIGGYAMTGDAGAPRYTPREVAVIRSAADKRYAVDVRFPADAVKRDFQESIWEPLTREFKKIISANRSTLLFTNSRRLCEKIAMKINEGESQPLAYAHHGSLSREIRAEVERKLKQGELRAIVATNSLELGIDIGSLDEVALIQSPPSVSSAIQRVGRAGHNVGEVSRGAIFPTHEQDFLEAAVLAEAIAKQDIEKTTPIRQPLDVLAQVIVSMTGVETWDLDELYAHIRTSYPYRYLSRQSFDLVLNMLAGRYADSRIRELKPRVSIDRLDNTVRARKGALLALYMSGGVIPDRGYYRLRHGQTDSRIGELDEEFVWEARVGQVFTLGAQNWKIERITHNDVFVTPAPPNIQAAPFWRAEDFGRDFHFSENMGLFLETANDRLDDSDFTDSLKRDYHMDDIAAEQLVEYLKRQKEDTGTDLPNRHHVLVEYVSSGPGAAPGNQIVIHTLWGSRVNRPFAMALDAAWEQRYGQRLEIFAGNDCVTIILPHQAPAEELLGLVPSGNIESLLRQRLEGSGFFGARFRECAGRALLVTRNKFNERLPLWMSRLRSQKLMEAVSRYADFPILLEAWRSCLQDEFDMDALRLVVGELETGAIGWSETHTARPSPMARSEAWSQINQYVYMGDEPVTDRASRLREDLFRDAVFTPELRPSVSPDLVENFEEKRRRLYPGYSPETGFELLEWVKERVVIPSSEWNDLLRTVTRDHDVSENEILEPIQGKLAVIAPTLAREPLVCALEYLPRVLNDLYENDPRVTARDLAYAPVSIPQISGVEDGEEAESRYGDSLGEWFSFYGPRTLEFVADTLGFTPDRAVQALEELADSRKVIAGTLLTGDDAVYFCDAANFETLLRMARRAAMPELEPAPIERLQPFIAHFQGITPPGENRDDLFQHMERLAGYRAPVERWEEEILPARMRRYDRTWLDAIMQEGNFRWLGFANKRIAFYFEEDWDLLREDPPENGEIDDDSEDTSKKEQSAGRKNRYDALFPDPEGRYDFSSLLRISNLSGAELTKRLWEGVWKSRIANDTFAALRKGVENDFRFPESADRTAALAGRRGTPGGRGAFSRWKASMPFAGNWSPVSFPDPENGLLDREERKKDRVRLLLERYGVLFRELLRYESPPFTWAALFRSLRLMELGGEVLSGYFFEGIPGPQFISRRALRLLLRGEPQNEVYWMNAVDPASLCGVQVEGLKAALPKRVATTHLVFRGSDLVMVSRRNGKSLTIHPAPDDSLLPELFGCLRHLLTREFRPLRSVTVEKINDTQAAQSPYVDALRVGFDVIVDYKNVTIYRRVQ